MLGLVADSRGLIMDGMTTSDMRQALIQCKVPIELQSQLTSLLESIESAEYGANSPTDISAMIASARSLVAQSVSYLERTK